MSAQPEVAITIMTGGHAGAAPGASTAEAAGPTPAPLDQLAALATGAEAGAEVGAGGPPTPDDLDQLAARARPAKKTAAKKTAARRR